MAATSSAATRAALGVVKWVAVAADRLRPRRHGIVILIYHRVGGGSGSEVDLEPERFAEQVAWLAASGRVVSLDAAIDHLGSPSPPPGPDPVVITFDDGTRDFTETAVPILVEHGVPATLYLATGFVEDDEAYVDGARPTSWAALADAVGTGLVDVGSHTHTHRLLDRASPEEARDELDRSVGLIQARLDRPARHFAYPKAVLGSPTVELAVRERFRSAAVAGTRPNPHGRTDLHRLARSPVQVSDGMRFFRAKAAGGMVVEDALRRTLNRWRYAGLRA